MSEQVTADQVTADPAVVTVTFVPTVDDQVRANREVTSTRWSRFFAIAAPVVMGLMTAQVVLTEGWNALLGTAMVFPIIFCTSLLTTPIIRLAVARNRRQNPHLVGPHAYTFGEGGVHLESPLGTVNMPWSSFVRARETRGLFLFHFARKAAYFLPRRALRDHDEARLRELVAAHLGARAELTYQRNR